MCENNAVKLAAKSFEKTRQYHSKLRNRYVNNNVHINAIEMITSVLIE